MPISYKLVNYFQRNQGQAQGMKDTLNTICEDCADDYANAEKKLQAEITDLRAQAEKLSNGIFKCIEDPCWQKNLLHGGADSPCA